MNQEFAKYVMFKDSTYIYVVDEDLTDDMFVASPRRRVLMASVAIRRDDNSVVKNRFA